MKPRSVPAVILGCAVSCVCVLVALSKETTTITSNVKVVNVLATVRDKKGNIVNDLAKDDFKLQEDGKPQTIRYFRKETDMPLSLGLLVDTSASQREVLDQERTASYTFLDQMLRDKDSAFLIHFDREVELLQDFTSSRAKLQKAMDSMQTPQLRRASDPQGSDPQGGGPQSGDPNSQGRGRHGGYGHGGGGTTLYDAVFLSGDELLKKQPGRKTIILLTDGVDHGSKVTLARAIEAAQRADTIVYSVYFPGQEGGQGFANRGGFGGMGRHGGGMGYPGGGWPGGGGAGGHRFPQEASVDGKKILQQISNETGGRMFEVSRKEPIDKIYGQIEEELRNQYSLGYTPAKMETGYHKITVETDKKDMKVQAREGYYASAD